MRGRFVLFALCALFAVPLLLAMPLEMALVKGGPTGSGLARIAADGKPPELKIPTAGANGLAVCWREDSWAEPRKVSFAVDWSGEVVIRGRRPSPEHACAEMFLNSTGQPAPGPEYIISLDPLPPATLLAAIPLDGKPLELVAGPDGDVRVWLIGRTAVGKGFVRNFALLAQRSAQLKPFPSVFGLALFVLWFPLMLAAAYPVLKGFRTGHAPR
jgi:hypothetical protein